VNDVDEEIRSDKQSSSLGCRQGAAESTVEQGREDCCGVRANAAPEQEKVNMGVIKHPSPNRQIKEH